MGDRSTRGRQSLVGCSGELAKTAQNPLRRQLCKYLNPGDRRTCVSVALKQVFLRKYAFRLTADQPSSFQST